MVYGDNKGHTYEKKIVQIMNNKKIIPNGKHGAGSGPGTDITFLHRGREYKIEIKNSVTDPDYGQKRLIPKKKWKQLEVGLGSSGKRREDSKILHKTWSIGLS